MSNKISSGVVIISTLVGICMLIFPRDLCDLAFILLCLVLTASTRKSLAPVYFFLQLLVPFAIPLFIVHAIINPLFAPSLYLFDIVPIRLQGVVFSLDILRQIVVFLGVAVMWLNISGDNFLDWLISRNAPLVLYAIFAQAIAIIKLIERRANIVYSAQQARGIDVNSSVMSKLKALPSVMIPVIATIINEADFRATALVSRGFASTRMSAPNVSFFQRRDHIYISILFAPLVFKILLWTL